LASDDAAIPTSEPRSLDEKTPAAPAVVSTDLLAVAIQAANEGDFGNATDLCRQYLQTTPQNAAAYCLLGLILQSQQQFDEARTYYERALYLDPEHAESLTHLMLDAQRQGDRLTADNYARRLHRLQQKLLANETLRGGSQ
jgi:chemotaxis protein methyltransferase WspC